MSSRVSAGRVSIVARRREARTADSDFIGFFLKG
jgi:hypothetical protein